MLKTKPKVDTHAAEQKQICTRIMTGKPMVSLMLRPLKYYEHTQRCGGTCSIPNIRTSYPILALLFTTQNSKLSKISLLLMEHQVTCQPLALFDQ